MTRYLYSTYVHRLLAEYRLLLLVILKFITWLCGFRFRGGLLPINTCLHCGIKCNYRKCIVGREPWTESTAVRSGSHVRRGSRAQTCTLSCACELLPPSSAFQLLACTDLLMKTMNEHEGPRPIRRCNIGKYE